MITRRCTQRQFLLTPCPRTNQIIRYALAYAAKVTGVQLHAVCFMSNHWHGIVSDPGACLPKFLEHFHRLIAKAQNAWLHRRENFWSSERASVVHLETDSDVLSKMAYVIANPIAARLVERLEDWPGLVAYWSHERTEVPMPDVFFDHSGDRMRSANRVVTKRGVPSQVGVHGRASAEADTSVARGVGETGRALA